MRESNSESDLDARPTTSTVPLYSLSLTVPLTVSCDLSMSDCSSRRYGLNQ